VNHAKSVLIPAMDHLVRLKRAVWEEEKAVAVLDSQNRNMVGSSKQPYSSQLSTRQ
jgi:hypothetical protein